MTEAAARIIEKSRQHWENTMILTNPATLRRALPEASGEFDQLIGSGSSSASKRP